MCLAWQGYTVPFTELVVWTERLNMNVRNHSFANYIKFFFQKELNLSFDTCSFFYGDCLWK